MKKPRILSHNYTGNSLVIVFAGEKGVQTKIVESSHINWKQVERAYQAQNLEKVLDLIDVKDAIKTTSGGKFIVKDGAILHNGEKVNGYLFDRILNFLEKGMPYKRLLIFAQKLWENPSEETRSRLYKFLEHGNNPITDDGCFLAYKGVQSDYFSITAGKLKLLKGRTNEKGQIFNGVGEEVVVDRSEVNPDSYQTCSFGLHAGSYKYANQFKGSGKLMIVKIDPKDVVSVPQDEGGAKLRTCRYEVIAENGAPLDEIKHANLDKSAKTVAQNKELGYHSVRDAKGRWARVPNDQ